jgi:glutaredoxin 3
VTIKTGDNMPAGSFGQMTDKGPGSLSTDELFSGKKVVLFSVPGAFTPTCSAKHLPGYLELADQLKAKGVDAITEVRIDLDPQARQNMMERTGRRTVPQIFIGTTHVGGCDDLIALDARAGLLPLLQAA